MSDNDIKDDFWDIDRIIPKRQQAPTSSTLSTEPTEISFGAKESIDSGEKIPERSETQRHRTARMIIEKAENRSNNSSFRYEPENPDFVSVTVSKWPSFYTFYDKFLIHGMKYLRVKAPECEYVPFLSYMPQYNQLNLPQLKYYLWWRRNVRRNHYLQTDSGYIFLYIYELINIEEGLSAEYRLNQMCNTWIAYRRSFPKLDEYLCEWVCDFCLINRLSLPECIKKISDVISYKAFLREFYTDPYSNDKKENLKLFIALNSKYNYKNSVIYEKHKEEFDKHILAAAAYALDRSPEINENEGKPKLTKLTRDSYSGALCVCSVKRKIEIEYYSHFKSAEFKNTATMLVRKSEALLSKSLGIKKKCTVPELSEKLIADLEEYYKIHFPPKSAPVDPKKEAEKIRYELYEAIDHELNIENALSIEDRSWDTTLKLIPQEELEQMVSKPIAPAPPAETPSDNVYSRFLSALSPLQYEFLKLLHGGEKQAAFALCKKNNLIPASVENEINELASDITDDIITQDLEVIGDYADELKFQ